MRDVMLNSSRAIAYQGGCYVLNAAGTMAGETIDRIARDEADRGWLAAEGNLGGSCIVGPGGEILAGPAGSEETILTADLDLDELVGKRAIHDYAGHYNRADVLSLVIHQPLQPILQAPWLTAPSLGEPSEDEDEAT